LNDELYVWSPFWIASKNVEYLSALVLFAFFLFYLNGVIYVEKLSFVEKRMFLGCLSQRFAQRVLQTLNLKKINKNLSQLNKFSSNKYERVFKQKKQRS